MTTQKATSTPLNLKSKMQNQGKVDWVKKQYPMFLVKREESRDFDVFFQVFFRFSFFFFSFFLDFGREKKCLERLGSKQTSEKMSFASLRGAWGYLQPQHELRGGSPLRAIDGPSRAASLKVSLTRLILTLLERSCLPISEKVWNLKIQQLNQKLWLLEVCGASIGASS